jgi:hypothetical protein
LSFANRAVSAVSIDVPDLILVQHVAEVKGFFCALIRLVS